jgi:hypothetical protein
MNEDTIKADHIFQDHCKVCLICSAPGPDLCSDGLQIMALFAFAISDTSRNKEL